MALLLIFAVILSAYIAGAVAEGMNRYKYGWKKDAVVLFFLMLSCFLAVVLVGYVNMRPV